ncbi:MAG: SDR family NAD(P)-dependent oxidoreductase, partial [Rhodococcus sp. (in: high G+C Gram-positive bacteria)]
MTTPAGPPVAVVTGAGGGLGAVTATVLGEL